jgi:hypothetical protein
MADQVNLHISALGVDALFRWVAIRLADGGSDGTLYDTRSAAVTHQSDSRLCTYVQIQPFGMTPREAEPVLRFTRWAYDHGYKITDPADAEPIMPNQRADLRRLIGANN